MSSSPLATSSGSGKVIGAFVLSAVFVVLFVLIEQHNPGWTLAGGMALWPDRAR